VGREGILLPVAQDELEQEVVVRVDDGDQASSIAETRN
jgi:hypothetical protein